MPCMHLGLHLVPWQGCGGKRGGGEEAYLAGGQQVVLGRKGPSLCCGQAAPGAWCGGASGRRGLRAGPLSLPSPPSRRLPPPLQRAPARGGSREARSPVAAPRRGLYSCQADGEELTLPTGLLPPTPPHPRRPPAAWRTLNPLRASGARPGRPSRLLPAAAATSREAAFPGPDTGLRVRVSRRSAHWPGGTGEAGGGKAEPQAWSVGFLLPEGAQSLPLPRTESGVYEASNPIAPFYGRTD